MEEREKLSSSLVTILSELSPEVLSDEDIRQSAVNLIGLFKLLSDLDAEQAINKEKKNGENYEVFTKRKTHRISQS